MQSDGERKDLVVEGQGAATGIQGEGWNLGGSRDQKDLMGPRLPSAVFLVTRSVMGSEVAWKPGNWG